MLEQRYKNVTIMIIIKFILIHILSHWCLLQTMKTVTPEISWHERDPIYSVDFQHQSGSVQRLATCGTDRCVRVSVMWLISYKNRQLISCVVISNLFGEGGGLHFFSNCFVFIIYIFFFLETE